MGIEPGRLKLLWASAAEGAIFAAEINKFVEEVRALGPLNWAKPGELVSTPIMEEVTA
jgi:coenzyme F420-reducing hydrogenase delta subunit